MTTDPLESPGTLAWRDARREALVPSGFVVHLPVEPPRAAALPRGARAHGFPGWMRVTVVAAGGAWFLARLAGFFLPFMVR
jgi:hypothetical protein